MRWPGGSRRLGGPYFRSPLGGPHASFGACSPLPPEAPPASFGARSARPSEALPFLRGARVPVFLLALALGAALGAATTRGEKTQLVRIGDVVLFAPLLVVAGGLLMAGGGGGGAGAPRTLLGAALVLVGAGTATFNAVNYRAEAEKKAAAVAAPEGEIDRRAN
jgi:hypothetical protein